MPQNQMGQSLTRLEDARFLTGAGEYIDDVVREGCLHVVFVRSEYAHANIRSVDTNEAEAMPGVVGIVSQAELAADAIGSLPCAASFPAISALVVPPRPALADATVRHVGDPILAVVARSYVQAQAGAEAVTVEYEGLPSTTNTATSLDPDLKPIWTQAPGNLAFRYENGDQAGVESALSTAAHVVSLELVNNRVTAAPMETRAGIAWFDPSSDSYTLHCNGQGLHGIRNQLADSVFNIAPERLRVSAPDVGGGFGLKNFVYPEWVVLLWAAKRFSAPVRWSATRSEDFVSAAYGRDMTMRAQLGLDDDGNVLALHLDAVANLGAYLSGSGPNISTRSMPTAMGGIYAVPSIYMQVRGAFSNTVPVDAYRGAGKPEANYLIERLMDLAAKRLNVDRFELRKRNAMHNFPHKTALGQTVDGGKFSSNIDRAMELADVTGIATRKQQTRAKALLRGLGVGCFMETYRGTPEEGAEVCFRADGTVELCVGTESQGQGHETAYAQIAADLLGMPMQTFRYVQADTELTRMGHGHGGARTMHMGGMALSLAIDAVIIRARGEAAQLLQAEAESLSFQQGTFITNDSSSSIDLLAVAAHVHERDGAAGGLDAFASHHDSPITFPNGCHIAEVVVDPDTGVIDIERYVIVDDYGNLINPRLTIGQVVGGVAQGIGQAVGEVVAHDEDSGQLLSASFMDYGLPRADDLPDFEVHLEGTPTKANPLGVKGSGQAGCIVAPQTIVNAVIDALAPLGIEHVDMPLTPLSVWQAIQSAKAGA